MKFETTFVSCQSGEIRTITSALDAAEVEVVVSARARGGDPADVLALRRAYLDAPFGFVPMRPEVKWLDSSTAH
jgi:hypothetical protein